VMLGASLLLSSSANDNEAVLADVSSLLFSVLVLFESQSPHPINIRLNADAAPSWRQVRLNFE
jgi:hypothetical protein